MEPIDVNYESDKDTIRKAIAAFLTSALAWGGSVVVSNPPQITAGEWIQAAGVGVAAFLVWLVPNRV